MNLSDLREVMARERLNACIFPCCGPHQCDHVAAHWKSCQWVSGFIGSGATAVVTMTAAALWVDACYAAAAASQLAGTEFLLMKRNVDGTPTVSQWLGRQINEARSPYSDWREVAIDGMCSSVNAVRALMSELRAMGGITVRTNFDPLRRLWTDRPPIPSRLVSQQQPSSSVRDNLARIRQALRERHADGMLMASLDDTAWTLNLQATDASGQPSFAGFLLIAPASVTFFVDRRHLSSGMACYLHSEGVDVDDYVNVAAGLRSYFGYNMLLDPDEVSYTLYKTVVDNRQTVEGLKPAVKIMEEPSPVPRLRS